MRGRLKTISTEEHRSARQKDFARRLVLLRIAKGWSIEELARKSGVHRNVVSKLESGTGAPHALTLGRLANALDVDVSELYDLIYG